MLAWSKKYDLYLLLALVTAYCVFTKVHQFVSFGVGGELADFETIIWNTCHGRFLQMKCSDVSFFSEHFSPILLFLTPIYAVVQSPYTLLVIHAVACSIAIIPLYRLVEFHTPLRWPPIAVSLAYAVSRVVNYGLIYDFHFEIFYPFLFFSAFLAFSKKKWWLFYLFIALAACVKEDAFIAIAGIGLFVFFSGFKRHGLATTLFGIGGLLIVVGFIIPYFRQGVADGDWRFLEYWSGYGSTKREIMLNFLNPIRHFEVIFAGEKLKQMFNLFSVFLFLPFFSLLSILFLIVPNWFVLYSSSNGLMNGPILYYGLLITPFLFFGALNGIERICKRKPPRRNTIILWATTMIFLVQFGNSRLFKEVFECGYSIPGRYTETAPKIIGMIPPDASVSAQINLVSHVPPHPSRTFFPSNIENTAYIFLDTQGGAWPLSEEEYKTYTDSLKKSPIWKTNIEEDGFILLSRVHPGDKNELQP